MPRTLKPHGLWPSPVTPAVLSQALSIPEAEWSPDGRHLVWLEEHSGQGILFAEDGTGDAPRRLTGEVSVRAGVGYGGGNFTVGADAVYYVERDGRLYAQPLAAGEPRALTPAGVRCASPALSPDGAWLAYVFEEGERAGLAVVDAAGRHWPRKLTEGLDFYMHPAWRPDGRALAWVGWNHPNMPWDGSRLYLAAVENGPEGPRLAEAPRAVAGGDSEAVAQPAFSPAGDRLAWCGDASGWWRVYVSDAEGREPPACLTEAPGEFGGAAWQQAMRWIGWLPEGNRLIAARNREGGVTLCTVDAGGGGVTDLPAEPYTTLTRPVVNPADGRIAALAAGDTVPPRLVVLPAADGAAPRIVRRAAIEQIPADDLSPLRYISWTGEDGGTVHGLFAPPNNSHFDCEGAPPLVVQIHGGPTSQAYRTWRPDAQFFTSRGYAFLDVNHRGSTGYGRAYRDALREQWGLLDVADVVAGVAHVTGQGWADPARCAIRGGSAGGYTVLRALTLHPEVFRAAVCFYGISELFALARDTHKFEAHYLDTLIGPLPEQAARYRERSPIHMADRIRTPLLIFQGEEDKVVPPAQSELIVSSLKARGVAHEYHLFPGEGHGFRNNANVKTALEAMERFLATHLAFG